MFRYLNRRWLLAVATLTLLAAAMLGTAGSASAAPPPPTPETCPAVRVTSAQLVRTSAGPALNVRGIKPHPDTRIALVAEDVAYVQQPDYWNYFVLGCGGTGEVTKVRFAETLPISGPRGRCGIQVHSFSILVDPQPGCENTI